MNMNKQNNLFNFSDLLLFDQKGVHKEGKPTFVWPGLGKSQSLSSLEGWLSLILLNPATPKPT